MTPAEVGSDRRGIDRATLMDAVFEIVGIHLRCDAAVAYGVGSPVGLYATAPGGAVTVCPPTTSVLGDRPAPDAAPAVPDVGEPPEIGRRCLAAGAEAIRRGGTAFAALAAGNEVAVRAFLEGRIGLSTVPEIVERTIDAMGVSPMTTADEVRAVEREARELATSLLGGAC